MMQTKRKLNRIVLLVICCFAYLNSFATSASVGPEQVLGPCIDDQTFAVVHLDVEKVDIDAYVSKFLSLVNGHGGPDIAKQEQDNLKNYQAIAGAKLNDLLKAGCRDVFAVFSMYDFPYFFIAVPIHSAGDQTKLYEQIQKIAQNFKIGDIELYVSDRLILVGLKRTITRLKTVSPVLSQTLAAGFQACANTTAQVVLFPNSDQRRILSEMLPQIPSESGNIKLTTVSEDLQWAALGFNGPPSISLNITVQSPNAEGAERLLKFIKNLYALAGQNSEVREFMPKIDQLLKLLTPRKRDKRLLLQIDSTTADSIINEFLDPSLTQARTHARRIACASNLKGIGMALMMYSNDHKDKFPPDLETLVAKTYLRENKRMLICPASKLRESYIYRGATITVKDTPWMITVYENQSNHGGGRNVLFLDGHTDWVTEERFQELIKRDNEYRRGKGLQVLPAQ
jgi:prepilin-type processing-associated H-X9-DG protein